MIEVPIYFIVVMALLVAAGFTTAFAINVTKKSEIAALNRRLQGSVSQAPWRPSLVSDKKHGLRRCWFENARWRWQCECGIGASVPNISNPTGEEIAIKGWRSHVEVHERLVLPTNELSHAECDKRFVGLWALFENWRTACYCQTTSNDLILLNQEAKKFEPKPAKEIEEKSE